jgi:hypothetical protein
VLRMVDTTAYALVASRCRYRMLHTHPPRDNSRSASNASRHAEEKRGGKGGAPEVERNEDKEEEQVLVRRSALALQGTRATRAGLSKTPT